MINPCHSLRCPLLHLLSLASIKLYSFFPPLLYFFSFLSFVGVEEMEAGNIWVGLLLLVGALMSSTPRCCACDFYVGGRDGWVTERSESFNKWAGRNRFLIHDRLVFKYKHGKDSVLVVKKEDYHSCNTKNPIQRLDGGNSVFQLDRSGPFFFISGVRKRCRKGQKLTVVVMADRHKTQSPQPSPSSPFPSFPPLPPPSSTPSTPQPIVPASPSTPWPSASPSSSSVSASAIILGASLGLVAFVLNDAFFS